MEAEVAERFKEIKQHVADHYASKLDIAILREEIAAQFGQVHVKFAEMESTIIKWFVATSLTLVGMTFAIARYVH